MLYPNERLCAGLPCKYHSPVPPKRGGREWWRERQQAWARIPGYGDVRQPWRGHRQHWRRGQRSKRRTIVSTTDSVFDKNIVPVDDNAGVDFPRPRITAQGGKRSKSCLLFGCLTSNLPREVWHVAGMTPSELLESPRRLAHLLTKCLLFRMVPYRRKRDGANTTCH